jgi:ankyrin repeat protein
MKSKLSAFLHFGYNQVCVRDSLRDLLDDDPIYLWNEIKPLAHEMIEFLTFYLTRPEVRERLIEMYDEYFLLYNASDNLLTPSVQPDGTDFIFYAVTAFPYHLDRHPEFLQKLGPIFESPEQPLIPWAWMYWAMDNPFSRPSEPIDSPIATLLWATLSVRLRKALISAMDGRLTRTEVSNASQESNDVTTMHLLAHAMSVGDETAALEHVRRALPSRASHGKALDDESISVSKGALEDHSWHTRLLWRATWLNMDQLVELLIDTGVPPDPEDVVSARYPSPLYVASLCGHTRVVQALVQAEANTGVVKDGEVGIMCVAAAGGHSDTVRALVAADREFLELHQPVAPLYIAATRGQWRTVETLLDLGAQVDTNPTAGGWTPLLSASFSGYIQTVRTLLEHEANPNLCDSDERYVPLWLAALLGDSVECVRALLEHGADPNHELLQPPLATDICRASHISTEKKIVLLDCLVDNTPGLDLDRADPQGRTCLMWAARLDDTALVEWLLAHNVDVCATSEELHTALYYAVANGNQQTIRALLTKGSPVNNVTTDGETLLQLSVGKGVEQMSLLLDAKADIELENGDNQTALNKAVEAEKPDVVKLLIERKANIHHRDSYGWSPIHDASYYRPNVEVVRLLADAGANLTETVNGGQTPLHLAARDARPDIVAVLLEHRGALDIEQRTEDGETPLVKAVHGNNLECVRRLLQAGANINAQCQQGWTPLMEAIYHSRSDEMTGLLLSQPGVDIHLFSPKHGAALHLACTVLNLTMVTELLDRRADVNQQVLGLRSTPIRAACLPENAPDSNSRHANLDKIDQIVRTLVAHGADVHALSNTPMPTLLCAAALNSGPSTINYLISEGLSLDQQDCLGRVPVH